MNRGITFILVGIFVSSLLMRPASAATSGIHEATTATHAPLVYAPATGFIPGTHDDATLIGSVIFGSFGSTASSNADLYVGLVPTSSTPSKVRVNFANGTATLSNVGAVSGDCTGAWQIGPSNDAPADNAFVLEYAPAPTDRLTVTLSNADGVDPIHCTLAYKNFGAQVNTLRGSSVARLLPLMNYLEVNYRRPSNSSTYTNALTSLNVGAVALGDVFPVTATTLYTASTAGIHLGDGFVISGVLRLGGNVGSCTNTSCFVELKFGTRPARLVIENVISGWMPHTDWQFTGPHGIFSLPNNGGTTVIEPLGSTTVHITQTAKPGYRTTSSCSDGTTGDVAVTVTPNAGETLTCTFTSAITPTYTWVTVTPHALAGWTATQAISGTGDLTPVALAVRSLPAPGIGQASAMFAPTADGVSTRLTAPLLTETQLADLLVLTYSTFLETDVSAPSLQLGLESSQTVRFVPNSVLSGEWQIWDTLSDDDGRWVTSDTGPCDASAGGCTWTALLAAYPEARIAANGTVGVEVLGNAARVFVDRITLGATDAFITYDFEPECAPYRVFNVSTSAGFCSIQDAIDDFGTVSGQTISVSAGVYTEAVRLNKDGLTLIGASGAPSTVLIGPMLSAAPGDATIRVTGANNTLDGLTFTRDGNTVAAWADARDSGVRFEGSGNTLRNSIITGNRNGVVLLANNNTVSDNDIVSNRVGVLVGAAANSQIQRNAIADNWAVGVLFRQAASITGNAFAHNKLTGNWFAQVEDRGNPDGQTRMFENNYFGPTPFSSAAQSTAGQPDDQAFIPAAYGGTGAPPASSLTFVVNPLDPHPSGDPAERGNTNTSRIGFTPWLCDGTDTSPAPGFQPVLAAICDGTPPDTLVVSGPISPANTPSATFVFSGTHLVTPSSYLSFECSIDGRAWSICASPFSASGLSDDRHTFEVRAKDADGTTDTTPALHEWYIDTLAPDTTLNFVPDVLTDDPSPTFGFSGTDVGTGVGSFECRLDGGAWAVCTTPHSYAVVSNGTHHFAVRAVDLAGNADSVPARVTWAVNTLEPDTMLRSTPPSATAQPFATFTFTGTDGLNHAISTFQCRLDNAAWNACTSPINYVALAEGEHEFDVQAVNALGITDTTFATFAWLVDATGPSVEFTIKPSEVVSAASAQFEFASDDGAGSGVLAHECQLDGAAWRPCASPIVLQGLANGAHVFNVRSTDAIGNKSAAPASASWTVDADAPNTVIVDAPPALTQQRIVSVTFSGADNVTSAAALAYECRLDLSDWNACLSPIHLGDLSEGSHTFATRAIDGLGSSDPTPATTTWTVDSLAPETVIESAPPDIDGNSTQFVFVGDDGAGSGGASFACQLDGGAWATCASPTHYSDLMAGEHTFAVRAIDRAGNVDDTPVTHAWLVDASLPNTKITLRPRAATSETVAVFAFAGDDDTTLEGDLTFECSLDLGVWSVCANLISTTLLAEGQHTMQVRAKDAGGNVDPSPATAKWLVDTTPPDTFVSMVGDNQTWLLIGVDDAVPSAEIVFECRWNNSAWFVCANPIVPGSNGMLDVRAIDPAGNVDPTPAHYMANVVRTRIYFPWTPLVAR